MGAQIIDGKALAAKIRDEVKREVQELNIGGIYPGLAVILVGEDPASQIYVRNKHRSCQELGIK
ncbi:MAG TPA: tetrahydrofolate dehydrogenase/cyclohydrolase catalytic domain-containing protein, partial [Bacillota bacterium]